MLRVSIIFLVAAILLLRSPLPTEASAQVQVAVEPDERNLLSTVSAPVPLAISSKMPCRSTPDAVTRCTRLCGILQSFKVKRTAADCPQSPYPTGCCLGVDNNASNGYCYCCTTTTCPSDTTNSNCVVVAIAAISSATSILPPVLPEGCGDSTA